MRTRYATFPLDARRSQRRGPRCSKRALGGSVLITGVEQTPAIVQERLIELFACLLATRERPGGVRLIAGTTTALHERVAAGRFSDRLFYRLNIIHIIVRDEAQVGASAGARA